MLHIYRQITSLSRVHPIVIAQKRENAKQFAFDDVQIVAKSPTHFLRRFWYRQVRDAPWQISRGELSAVLAVLQKENAKLLHIYFGHIAVHLLPLIQRWDRRTVVSFHGADAMVDLTKPAYRAATLRMLDLVRMVLVRSDSLGAALRSFGCPPDKIRVQRTGVPLQDIKFREPQWPTDGRWHLIQAGRLVEKKGLKTTLQAFARFKELFPLARLTVAGEGPLQDELEKFATHLKLGGSVAFSGFLSQRALRELFYEAHLFVHPSETASDGNQEGVPNSMLEAMATGLPVFATTHGGIPEAIDHGVSGMLVNERDYEALATELISAARQPDLLARLGQAGRRAVEANFDQAIQTRQLEDTYIELMNEAD
jgi:glycosyltransferase involved in cell wall biosynthesis